MCCEVICDLELQMRICNGESVEDLTKTADKLPYVRVLELRDGRTGYFGGGANSNDRSSTAYISRLHFRPDVKNEYCTPYAFRVLS